MVNLAVDQRLFRRFRFLTEHGDPPLPEHRLLDAAAQLLGRGQARRRVGMASAGGVTSVKGPDGRLVAVAVGRIDLEANEYRAELWMMPTDGSAPPRRFTSGRRDVRPRFSPDGRWLAFLRAGEDDKPQLHVMATDGGEPRRVCEHPLGVEGFAWSPDSTRIAYVARVPQEGRYGTDKEVPPEKEPPRRITTFQYRLDNLGFTFDRRPQVFVVDALAEGAEPVQVTRGDYDHGDPAWSPDGTKIQIQSAMLSADNRSMNICIIPVPDEWLRRK